MNATQASHRGGKTPLGLPSSWFWDVNPARLDPEQHAAQIIERVLAVGTLEGWKTIRRHYGDDRLRGVVTQLRSLSPQNVALLCLALDLRKEDFRCCTARPFPPAPWKADFVAYPYPLLAPPETIGEARMLSLPDVVAMKLAAVSNRGAKKDFYDLHMLLSELGFDELLRCYRRKFPNHDPLIPIRSMIV